jgi:LacI family transcriptional regulator
MTPHAVKKRLHFVNPVSMPTTRRIAFVSSAWTKWQHRLMAGALRFAETHPRVLVRAWTPVTDLATAARELTAWPADGLLAHLDHDDLQRLLRALPHPPPIVNTALAQEQPGVVTLIGDFSAFVDAAVGHLRQLGLRSLAVLLVEEGPRVRESLIETFLRVACPAEPARASLVEPVDRGILWRPEAAVAPVPPRLAAWLDELAKPVGVLCPHLGGGSYLVRVCQSLGLRVPEDVAIVGADDTDLSLASEPTVTSVLLDLERFGCEAMRLLTEAMAGRTPPSPTVRLQCVDLQVRESTGRRRPEICDIAAALEFIRQNACRGITVEQVLRQTQRVSRVTFHRRFRETVGQTPAQAIRERRLEEVRRLLTSTDLALGMISDLCGFSSPKVLARLFRADQRTTPRDYRRQGRIPAAGQAEAAKPRAR